MSINPGTNRKEQSARVHSGQSNRRTKDRGERKTVFKSVLANPFEVKWPIISSETQNAILERLVDLLHGVVEYNLHRQQHGQATRKARRAQKRSKALAKSKHSQQNAMDVDTAQPNTENKPNASTSTAPASAPEILQHLTVGINEVTKQLEQQCQLFHPVTNITDRTCENKVGNRGGIGSPETTDNNTNSGITNGNTGTSSAPDPCTSVSSSSTFRIADAAIPLTPLIRTHSVLVCRADIDPPLLVAHIPYVIAAYNSSSKATLDPTSRIKLVSLPKGAESQLAKILGLRRVSVIAMDETVSRDEVLSTLFSSVETVVAPWLVGFGGANSPTRSASNTQTQRQSKNKTKTNVFPPKHAQLLRRRLEPTHIKQLRTTAPKDMRAAKALRAKGRAQAKAERKVKDARKKAAKQRTAKCGKRMKLVSFVGFPDVVTNNADN